MISKLLDTLLRRTENTRVGQEASDVLGHAFYGSYPRLLLRLLLDMLIAWSFLLLSYFLYSKIIPASDCATRCLSRACKTALCHSSFSGPCCYWSFGFVLQLALLSISLGLASYLNTKLTREKKFQSSAIFTSCMMLSLLLFGFFRGLDPLTTTLFLVFCFFIMFFAYRKALSS